MKKRVTLTMLLCFLCGMASFGQKLIEKNHFRANPALGGEVTIKESSKETVGDKTYTSFVANTDKAGDYTMNLWLMATELPGGTFSGYDVLVNGKKIEGRIEPTRGDWQSIGLTSGKVSLQQGENTISFAARVPEIPEIEFIKLSRDSRMASISSAKYDAYKAEITASIARQAKAPAKIVGGPAAGGGGIVYPPMITDTMGYGSVLQYWNQPKFTNPEGNYVYSMNMPVKYTYYRTVSLTAGQSFFVATDGVNNFGHILELFHATKPDQYSWVNKSNSRCLASIDITIPESGTYYVRVRSSKNAASGTTNLNINGQNYYYGIPLYSMGIRVKQDNETIYNTFTCYATNNTDPRIWIEEGAGSANPGKISAFNDDYSGGGGNFNWGSNSRIKTIFPRTMHAVQVTSYGSSTPVGTCDLYAKCRNSGIYPYFPNLKADDAIQSAPASTNYNAFAWSGGITQRREWPDSRTSEYFVDGDPLASFDNFYGDDRHTFCGIQSRTGATEANSVVDLYGTLNSDGSVTFDFASITKGADFHPHGYAWETKPGDNMRTFHPRYALNSGTNQVIKYYRRVSTGSGPQLYYTLAEAIAAGKTVIEQVEFTDFEKSVITSMKETMSTSEINNFTIKFNAWKAACNRSYSSSATTYKKFPEYSALVSYCRSTPGSEYLVFETLGNDEDLAAILLEDITIATSLSNRQKLDNIKATNARQKTNSSGATIVRFPYTNAMKLVKNLLSNPMYAPQEAAPETTNTDGMSYSNSDQFNVINRNGEITMNFTLPKDSKITLSIMDLNARPVTTILSDQSLVAGDYNYTAGLTPGIYLVELFVNGKYNVKKVIIN